MILLYHWSPTRNRARIQHSGLVPGSRSVDGEWRPPFVCLSDSPSLAWGLSGGMRNRAPGVWDLWMTERDGRYEEIWDHYPDTGRSYIKEYRVYERIWKRDVWYVATREA